MSDISTYLEQIESAVYGEDVRSAIYNAIQTCYSDATEGITPSVTTESITGGTRVNVIIGAITTSFDVMNGTTDLMDNSVTVQKLASDVVAKFVDAETARFDLDINAESGTVDGDLYASIVALDWENEVIEETQLILKKLFTKILRRTTFKLTQLYNTRTEPTKIGTVWEYHTHDFLADWDMIAIQFIVHEHVEVFYIVRGDTLERGLTDWPDAGKFRGSLYVNWANNQIGIRAINAGSSRSNYNLIYYSTIYGIIPK